MTTTQPKKAKRAILPAKVRNAINTGIYRLGSYFDSIPLDKLTDILDKNGVVLLQEDGTPYEGFFCGADGEARLELGLKESGTELNGFMKYEPVSNALLILNWFKQVTRYDVNTYVS